MNELHPIVLHLIYGDIDEMPLVVLGNECPSPSIFAQLDTEQRTRLAAAATVQAWIEGRLHKGGFIYDPARDKESDRIK